MKCEHFGLREWYGDDAILYRLGRSVQKLVIRLCAGAVVQSFSTPRAETRKLAVSRSLLRFAYCVGTC